MRGSKEEIPYKLAGQAKIVIMVNDKVAFEKEIMEEAGEMLLKVT